MKGDTGSTGPTGPTGTKGDTGPTGPGAEPCDQEFLTLLIPTDLTTSGGVININNFNIFDFSPNYLDNFNVPGNNSIVIVKDGNYHISYNYIVTILGVNGRYSFSSFVSKNGVPISSSDVSLSEEYITNDTISLSGSFDLSLSSGDVLTFVFTNLDLSVVEVKQNTHVSIHTLSGCVGPTGPSGLGVTGPTGPTGPKGDTGTSVTSRNYTWAYKTNSQDAAAAQAFDEILFTNTPELVDWTYNIGTGEFTCVTTGTYLIDYTVMGADSGTSIMSVRGAINNSEIIGSAITRDLQGSDSGVLFDNTFIVSVTNGDVFSIQFAGSVVGPTVQVKTIPALSGETNISAGVVITRIA